MFYPLKIFCPVCDAEAEILDVQVSVTEGFIFHVRCCQEFLFAVTWEKITQFCFEMDRESSTLQ